MDALLRFLFSALGLLAASTLVPGITHGGFLELLAVAVVLGALNATVGQLLKLLALVPVACSFGCFNLVINGLVFLLAGRLSTALGLHFAVSGFWAAFWGALVSSLVAGFLGLLFLPRRPRAGGPRGGGNDGPRPIKIVNP